MISVTILTKNNEKHLTRTLASLRRFPEVLVYDTGSSDNTCKVAKAFPNVRFVEGFFDGFGRTHNRASAAATHSWILSLDSDEVVTEALEKEILLKSLHPETVYSVLRHNYFNGKQIRWCGWHPDRVVRLYHREKTGFTEDLVHEKVAAGALEEHAFCSPLHHYPYDSIDAFLNKMQHYTTLFAEQNRGKKSSSPKKAFGHALFAFFRSYILKRGFLGGYEGLYISLYNAETAWHKYLKLYHLNQKNS